MMNNIIYLMQPPDYNTLLETIIKNILKEKYPNKLFKIKYSYPHSQESESNNIYFIINDCQVNAWDGLKLSQNIRANEPNAILILVSTDLDYTKFFRSHAKFLGVLNLKNISKSEIESYLIDSIENSLKEY